MQTLQECPLQVGKMRKEYCWLQITKIENSIKQFFGERKKLIFMTKDNEFGVICIKEAKKGHHLIFDDIIIVLYHLFDFRCVFIRLLHDITQLPG